MQTAGLTNRLGRKEVKVDSRTKGSRGELELARELQARGIDCRRGYVQFKQSDLVGIKGIHVECKRTEKLNIHNAMNQAVAEAKKRRDGRPTVFHRRNRTEWLVTMRLDEWIEMYKGWLENEEQRMDSFRQIPPGTLVMERQTIFEGTSMDGSAPSGEL